RGRRGQVTLRPALRAGQLNMPRRPWQTGTRAGVLPPAPVLAAPAPCRAGDAPAAQPPLDGTSPAPAAARTFAAAPGRRGRPGWSGQPSADLQAPAPAACRR